MAYERKRAKCLKEAVQCFEQEYGGKPSIAVSAPGRVNLIGEHTDYNGGFVLPMALPMMTVIVGRTSNSTVCKVISTVIKEEDKPRQEFPVPTHPGDGTDQITFSSDVPLWIKYVQGVVALMNKNGDVPGFEAVITSCVPLGGGVSSSASLEVAVGVFVEQLLGRKVPRRALALICQKAEHRYVGNKCGIMDQFISAMAKEGSALLIDCEQNGMGELKEDCAQQIPLDDPDLVVLVVDSGVRRELVGGEYNKRRETCERAVSKLGVQGKSLRHVSMQQLEEGKGRLDNLELKRARHVVSEITRTEQAAAALRKGDYKTFGKLMNDSHESLKTDYEVSCDALDKLVDFARAEQDPCVYGSRMTGGGFGGCTVTLLQREAVRATIQRIKEGYPEATDDKIYQASASRGAEVITDLLTHLG